MTHDDRAPLAMKDLNPALREPVLTSMDFLNEVVSAYPEAIPLAAGRPIGTGYSTRNLHRYIETFVASLGPGQDPAETLHQYGPAQGMINDHIVKHLWNDESVQVSADDVTVTVGCQEALLLTLMCLRRSSQDAVMTMDPTYVGLPGVARLLDMEVLPVREGGSGLEIAGIRRCVLQARSRGVVPRALYVVPTFSNPSGHVLTSSEREQLLDLAGECEFLIIEDNPYGLFHGDRRPPPSLKAMDEHGSVVYVGSFSKTIFPGLRLGYVAADQRVDDESGRSMSLASVIASAKSMTTINTPSITQALAAGFLIENGHRLSGVTEADRSTYDDTRAAFREAAEQFLDPLPGVRVRASAGGFFSTISVPFVADDAALRICAEQYGVTWTPMAHFFSTVGGACALRVAISAVDRVGVREGVRRLASFIEDFSA